MNVELASKVYNHITEHPNNHTELHYGEQNELGTVASVAAYIGLFSGLCKIKNRSIVLTEEDNQEPDWTKTTQLLLDIPFSVAFRLTVLSNDEQAYKAIGYIANGKLPNWREIYNIFPMV